MGTRMGIVLRRSLHHGFPFPFIYREISTPKTITMPSCKIIQSSSSFYHQHHHGRPQVCGVCSQRLSVEHSLDHPYPDPAQDWKDNRPRSSRPNGPSRLAERRRSTSGVFETDREMEVTERRLEMMEWGAGGSIPALLRRLTVSTGLVTAPWYLGVVRARQLPPEAQLSPLNQKKNWGCPVFYLSHILRRRVTTV